MYAGVLVMEKEKDNGYEDKGNNDNDKNNDADNNTYDESNGNDDDNKSNINHRAIAEFFNDLDYRHPSEVHYQCRKFDKINK